MGRLVLHGVLSSWVYQVRRRALWVVFLSLLLAAISALYAGKYLGVNTDPSDMFRDNLPWRQDYINYTAAFPVYSNTLLVVVDGVSADIAQQAAEDLSRTLAKDKELIQWVYSPGSGPFFDRNGLLYLDEGALTGLADALIRYQPFIARLGANPSMAELFDVLATALNAEHGPPSAAIGQLLDRIAATIEARLDDRFQPLSWWELLSGRTALASDRRRLVIVKPALDYTHLFPAGPAIDHVRDAAAGLQLDAAHGVQVRITGELALAHEEMRSVSRGMGVAALAALVLVAAILWVGLGSLRLVLVSLVTLVVGLLWTAAFAAFAVGRLNLISIAFAVLYIGLGIDYAIHYVLRCRELLDQGRSNGEALCGAAGDVGNSLVLCALTTGVGFYSFVPTDFSGVSELGLISGTGMLISLLTSLTVLPALLSLFPMSPGRARPSSTRTTGWSFVTRFRPAILIGATCLGLLAMVLASQARFDYNPINLRDPVSESVSTYLDLSGDDGRPPWTIVVTARRDQAPELVRALEQLPSVDTVRQLADFIPTGQQTKTAIIDELSLVLSLQAPDTTDPVNSSDIERLAAVDNLRRVLTDILPLEQPLRSSAERLYTVLERLLVAVRDDGTARPSLLVDIDHNLIAGLPMQLRRLYQSLQTEGVDEQQLPDMLRARWSMTDGHQRLEVHSKGDLADAQVLEDFVKQVRNVAPHATGTPVVYFESAKAAVRAFQHAFGSALILITIVLMLQFRNVFTVMMVLVPLLLGGVLTVAITVLFDLPFNFANVITLPLLLGIGVDSGIHMVQRMRSEPALAHKIISTSTSRAVVISVLTTLVSFGNLAFSAHRGTASMGIMLSMGLTSTLLCTLVVLPAMIRPPQRPPA